MISTTATGLGLFMEQLMRTDSNPPLDIIQSLIQMGAPTTPFKHVSDPWRPQYPRLPSTGDRVFWPFISALQRRQFDVCNLLIESGLDIKSTWPFFDLDQLSRLDIQMLEFLRQHLDLNARDCKGRTLLMIIITSERYDLVDYLLDFTPCDVQSREKNAIHSFFEDRQDEPEPTLMKLLRSGKFSYHSRDHKGRTPLMVAGIHGHAGLLFPFIGDSINDVDNKGQTAIFRFMKKAQSPSYFEQAKNLMSLSPDVSIVTHAGDTVFMLLVGLKYFMDEFQENPQTSTYQALIDAGADVHAKAKDGWTPLLMASLEGMHVFVSDLLSRGCDVNASDVSGITPLMASLIIYKSDETFEILLANGADVNAENCYGLTPLHFATFLQSSQPLHALLQTDCHIYAADEMGRTSLHLAMHHCASSHCAQLLEAGASINAQDAQGRVPISYFLMEEDDDIIAGGDECNCDPIDLQMTARYPKVHCCHLTESPPKRTCDGFMQYVSTIDYIDASIVDIYGTSLLHQIIDYAFERMDLEDLWPCLTYLINECDADVNAQNQEGETFLHRMIQYSDAMIPEGESHEVNDQVFQIVYKLYHDGLFTSTFDRTLTNKHGWTVLHMACRRNHAIIGLLTGPDWKKPADPNQFSFAGDAPVHLLVSSYASQYRDINLKHKRTGQTPLIMMVISARQILAERSHEFTDRVISGLQQMLAWPGIDETCQDVWGNSARDYGLLYCLTRIRLRLKEEEKDSDGDAKALPTIRWDRLFGKADTTTRKRRKEEK
eukprot:TRINITY_DN6030_c0_g1_i3.p1 TRINITY_DN6030_c0_g1~~TRINITY_DN6030_c0_g1_i3.p1  ORF type:complete len:773 (+),score=126.38 TRINITY_DN6030_c0_g1_i3:728-3046(+)